ncbi:MAG: ATP-binding protein [Pseudomonadota bacterium]
MGEGDQGKVTRRSLASRLVIAATLVLVTALGATGIILEAAVRDSFEEASRERLQAQIYGLLAVLNVSPEGEVLMPARTQEPRLNRPDSGLYAVIDGPVNRWQSASALGEEPELPAGPVPPGETGFLRRYDIGPEEAYVLRQGVAWEIGGTESRLTVSVAEHERTVENQIAAFRATLWAWLGGAMVVLLALQVAVLRWGLRPLRELADALIAVRRGERDSIGGHYPRELTGLRDAIDRFIDGERKHLERYRNGLADLAHSLKTPLTVLRSELEGGDDDSRRLLPQVDRMDDSIAWQLRRARSTGHGTVGRAVSVAEVARRIVPALEKVYAQRGIECRVDAGAEARFFGDAGDLMEILGNLLDNAFKYGERSVVLCGESIESATDRRPGLRLRVEDDGAGIPVEAAEAVRRRGIRADERVPGHGMGLAIVGDIVEAYGGTLTIEASPLGGAAIHVVFPEE